MLHIEIPGREPLALEHLVSDLNGTLALDGVVLSGAAERVARLGSQISLHILTAGTHGGVERAEAELAAACAAAGAAGPRWVPIATGADKLRYVTDLGAERVAALGNGANDEAMLRAAGLGIAVIGGEGACVATLFAAQVAVQSPLAALDLLLHPARLVATLRS